MSLLASTMSMFDSSIWKNGHSWCIACNKAIPSFGRAASQASTAVPKPYQPGNISRHCAQLKTQGIARRSSMRPEVVRDDGRLPMLRLAISPITVDSRK
jgi:hypothetical protein